MNFYNYFINASSLQDLELQLKDFHSDITKLVLKSPANKEQDKRRLTSIDNSGPKTTKRTRNETNKYEIGFFSFQLGEQQGTLNTRVIQAANVSKHGEHITKVRILFFRIDTMPTG
jgi:hypothetical protein